MKKNDNKRFFKMIFLQGSHFAKTYNISEIDNIYPGQRFVSHGKAIEWCQKYSKSGTPSPGITLQTAIPMIHFCDNAVDILMWYWEVFDFGLDVHFVEIKPVGTVYKNRANDETALWQCGVNKFEFVRHTTIKEVAQDACREIDAKCSEIIARYPQYNMQQVIRRIKRSAQK